MFGHFKNSEFRNPNYSVQLGLQERNYFCRNMVSNDGFSQKDSHYGRHRKANVSFIIIQDYGIFNIETSVVRVPVDKYMFKVSNRNTRTRLKFFHS